MHRDVVAALSIRGTNRGLRVIVTTTDPSLPVYLDCHASSPVDVAVSAAMVSIAAENPANAHSHTHGFGREAANAVECSRNAIAGLIGCPPASVTFMSGATEANNLAVFGVMRGAGRLGHVVSTAGDHKAILDPTAALEAEGFQRTVVKVDSTGQVDVDEVANAIGRETVLVTVIFANNEVGTINRITDIGTLCRERGVLFHTDATQAVGKIPINVSELPIDLMSFSAHKMYGPKGIGALYVRNEEIRKRIRPLIYGGGHERGLRSGTLPVPLIVGFGKACELCQELMENDSQRIGAMRDRLWERFQSEIPNVVLNGHPTERLYNNLNVSFLDVPSEAFMIKLRDVVAVSAGSACTSANPEPSHVLRAMGIHGDRLDSAIRFGLGRFNTTEEIEYVADHVRDAVAELRKNL